LIKIHSLLILSQICCNFNNLCEEAKIIFVLIIHFGDVYGVYEAVFLNWQLQIFFSAGDDRALVGYDNANFLIFSLNTIVSVFCECFGF
jgi:hypothetical protein